MRSSLTVEHSWSKTLFGNRHMLDVASSIAQGDVEFSAPQVERTTGLGASSVHRLLGVLCSVGLLARVPRRAGDRTQRYRRERQPFWESVSQMKERAHDAANASPVQERSVG